MITFSLFLILRKWFQFCILKFHIFSGWTRFLFLFHLIFTASFLHDLFSYRIHSDKRKYSYYAILSSPIPCFKTIPTFFRLTKIWKKYSHYFLSAIMNSDLFRRMCQKWHFEILYYCYLVFSKHDSPKRLWNRRLIFPVNLLLILFFIFLTFLNNPKHSMVKGLFQYF